jgi:hypothetical protein
MRMDSHFEFIDEKLQHAVNHLRDRFAASGESDREWDHELELIQEFVDVGEYGLALEHYLFVCVDLRLPISIEVVDDLRECARRMTVDQTFWYLLLKRASPHAMTPEDAPVVSIETELRLAIDHLDILIAERGITYPELNVTNLRAKVEQGEYALALEGYMQICLRHKWPVSIKVLDRLRECARLLKRDQTLWYLERND